MLNRRKGVKDMLRKSIWMTLGGAFIFMAMLGAPNKAVARTFERCDLDGHHCVRISCDSDGDRCHYVYHGHHWNPHWD